MIHQLPNFEYRRGSFIKYFTQQGRGHVEPSMASFRSAEKSKIRYRKVDQLRRTLAFIKKGDLKGFNASLTDKEADKLFRERLLAKYVPKECSPLVLAAQHNQWEMLDYLLDKFPANLEQETSTVIEGGHPVEGATPLWTASTLGHAKIVKTLVSRGADIEHTTESQSTPLRGAAFDGHLDVVEFLIEKGANIDRPNQVGQSPLTIAAAMQKVKTVNLLLHKGANLFHHGHNGDTPLHVAVESGSQDVTKILVEAGAKNTPNDVGYTPAILASCYGHHEIMSFLDQTFNLDPKELYDCQCLLFTKEVLNNSYSRSRKWLSKAISLRTKHPDLFKDLAPADPIYDDIQEPSKLSEIDDIIVNDVHSFFLCAVYCERILGDIHPTTAFYIRISGDMALEDGRYQKCMDLWLRSLHFDQAARMAYELQITEDLLYCVRGFCLMIENGFIPEVSQHFWWGIKEFTLAKESKIPETEVACCLCRMLAVWIKAISHQEEKRRAEEKKRIVESALHLQKLMEEKDNSLILACLQNTPQNRSTHHISASQSISKSGLPLHKVVAILIENGCSVHSEDSMGNYPLHFAVKLNEDSALNCIKILLEYGAHADAVNHRNLTALQIAEKLDNRPDIVAFLREVTTRGTSLQCLAARATVREGMDYLHVLPPQVSGFVAMHDADDVDSCSEDDEEKNRELGKLILISDDISSD